MAGTLAAMLRRLHAGGSGLPEGLEPRTATGAPATAVRETVAEILAAVAERGDAALCELSARLDGVAATPERLRVPDEALAVATAEVPGATRAALETAAGRVRAYHQRQLAARNPAGFAEDGIEVTERHVPVDAAGIYVPGGRAAYPSSVLMTVIPARVAGVRRVALCTPPGPEGVPPPITLAAASLAGVDEVYALGGAQAVAALAFGTATVPPVDVIAGPGNAWVAEAKRQVAAAGLVGIDGPAGPSELVVCCDGDADPEWAATDLVAQAEHGPGGRIVAVTWDPAWADALDDAVAAVVAAAERVDEVRATLAEVGAVVLTRDAEEALAVVEALAPEHLALFGPGAEALAGSVRRAGAVFVGAGTPVALGDYVAGPSHVLPTGGAARFASALGVDTFRRHLHVVRVRGEPPALLGTAACLARAEGLEAHAASLEARRR